MMDTVLNLGLNETTLKGLTRLTGDERFALDTHRRFIQLFSKIVLGISGDLFEHALGAVKTKHGAASDADDAAVVPDRVVPDREAAAAAAAPIPAGELFVGDLFTAQGTVEIGARGTTVRANGLIVEDAVAERNRRPVKLLHGVRVACVEARVAIAAVNREDGSIGGVDDGAQREAQVAQRCHSVADP